MQIYKEMNIGTAKSPEEEMKEVPHHMIDIVSPEERFSVSSYKKQAEKKIEEILKKGKTPIIVRRNWTIYRIFDIWNRVRR